MMLTFSFYGIQATGSKLENPFGFDDTDHDLEAGGRGRPRERE